MDLSSISKAIAGGLAGVLVAEAARYGFKATPDQVTLLSVVLTGVVGYIVGHVIVYFSPANSTGMGMKK